MPANLQIIPAKINISKSNKLVEHPLFDKEPWGYVNPAYIEYKELFPIVNLIFKIAENEI